MHADERTLLLQAVCLHPTDATAKLVFADWLDEHGEVGESMRWATKNQKRPCGSSILASLVDQPFSWSWCFVAHYVESLPLSIYKQLKRYQITSVTGHRRHYPSQEFAWNDFIQAFAVAYAAGKVGKRRAKKC